MKTKPEFPKHKIWFDEDLKKYQKHMEKQIKESEQGGF